MNSPFTAHQDAEQEEWEVKVEIILIITFKRFM